MNDGKHPAWLDIAFGESGVRRYGPGESNPRIVEYNGCTQLVGYDDKIAWCSSFVNWCMIQAGLIGTDSALAHSWLEWAQAIEAPRHGCIAVLTRKEATGWTGHVGFYLREEDDRVVLFGGNQFGEVRELAYPRNRVLAYRWPSDVDPV